MAVAVDASLTVGEHRLSVTFEAGPGITVLFGPSGAGKSLTLELIAGLRRPQHGTVRLAGTLVADGARLHVRTQQRGVGMVFQEALLLPHRSVLANIELACHGNSEIAQSALEQVDAGHLAAAKPARLSGGERQRVALARALVRNPPLLLLDEPFGAVDLPSRLALGALVRSLADLRNTAMLMVTHDPTEAQALADRTVVVRNGEVVDQHQGFDFSRAFAPDR